MVWVNAPVTLATKENHATLAKMATSTIPSAAQVSTKSEFSLLVGLGIEMEDYFLVQLPFVS